MGAAEKEGGITWTQRSKWHLESDCKTFTVAKMYRDSVVRYSAWQRRSKETAIFLGISDTAEGAKALCEAADEPRRR